MANIIILGKFEDEGTGESFELPKAVSVHFWIDRGAGFAIPPVGADYEADNFWNNLEEFSAPVTGGGQSINPTISIDPMLQDAAIAYWESTKGFEFISPGTEGLGETVALSEVLTLASNRLADGDEVHWVACRSFWEGALSQGGSATSGLQHSAGAEPAPPEAWPGHQPAEHEEQAAVVAQETGLRPAPAQEGNPRPGKPEWNDGTDRISNYISTAIMERNQFTLRLSGRECYYRVLNGRIFLSSDRMPTSLEQTLRDRFEIKSELHGSFRAKKTADAWEIWGVLPADARDTLIGLDWERDLGRPVVFRYEATSAKEPAARAPRLEAVRKRTRELLAERHGKEMRWVLIDSDRLLVLDRGDEIAGLYGQECAAYFEERAKSAPNGTIKFHQGGVINQPRVWLTGVPVDKQQNIAAALGALAKKITFRNQ
ncbi:hypothetical protein AB0N09_40640 [Streptomyces erythrochromogenes]|uniref:hypothetical protein n=1 Tax=Streptomyces erythrochromogenes TaxID=285574 RepID=UPI003423D12A